MFAARLTSPNKFAIVCRLNCYVHEKIAYEMREAKSNFGSLTNSDLVICIH